MKFERAVSKSPLTWTQSLIRHLKWPWMPCLYIIFLTLSTPWLSFTGTWLLQLTGSLQSDITLWLAPNSLSLMALVSDARIHSAIISLLWTAFCFFLASQHLYWFQMVLDFIMGSLVVLWDHAVVPGEDFLCWVCQVKSSLLAWNIS